MKTIDKIIKKAKYGLAGIGLISAIATGGCATSEDYANLGLAAQVAGLSSSNLDAQQLATLGAVANYGYIQSQNQARIDAAKESMKGVNGGINNSNYRKQILNEMKIKMKQIDKLYSENYVSEYERKKIKLKIELDTMKTLGEINEYQYNHYMKSLETGELIKSSKESFY